MLALILLLCALSAGAALYPVSMAAIASLSSAPLRYSPEQSADSILDQRTKRAYSTFLRVGFAAPSMIYMMDEDLKYYYNKSWGLMADCYFYRKKSRQGNGLDIGARFTYRNFKIGEEIQRKHSDLLYEDNRVHMMSWDICFRGMIGAYLLHELWQLYVVAAPRLLYYRSEMKDARTGGDDRAINLVSIGIVGGVGLEVTLVSMFGIFAEYNIGYTPVGTSFNNVEGHQVYVGLVWRTLGVGFTEGGLP